MEPITHLMTGACLARAGCNRKAAYATFAMVIAAEFPDLDVLWSIDGPIAGFQHHRGWTHTFLGIPFQAAFLVAAIYLFHRWRTRRAQPSAKPPAAPVRWGLLFLFTLLALASHLLLDWTNNYGLRPFFPFNPRWYAGSFVFIVEPVLLFILTVALIAPSLFALINSEVGARRQPFRGRGWAIAALLGTVCLWSLRYYEHAQAISLAQNADYTQPDGSTPPIARTFASPYPINPFRWATVVELPLAYQLATADTLHDTLTTTHADSIFKPPTTLATLVAKRSWLGEVYLDWSSWPLVSENPRDPNADPSAPTIVTFSDLRFMYGTSLLPKRDLPPLSATAYLNADRRVIRMDMDGRTQH